MKTMPRIVRIFLISALIGFLAGQFIIEIVENYKHATIIENTGTSNQDTIIQNKKILQ